MKLGIIGPKGHVGTVLAGAKLLRSGAAPRITADDCFRSTEIALRAREAADETKMIALPPMRPVRG